MWSSTVSMCESKRACACECHKPVAAQEKVHCASSYIQHNQIPTLKEHSHHRIEGHCIVIHPREKLHHRLIAHSIYQSDISSGLSVSVSASDPLSATLHSIQLSP